MTDFETKTVSLACKRCKLQVRYLLKRMKYPLPKAGENMQQLKFQKVKRALNVIYMFLKCIKLFFPNVFTICWTYFKFKFLALLGNGSAVNQLKNVLSNKKTRQSRGCENR